MAKITASNSASGKAIGTVKALVGTATATDSNGVTRTLQIGDPVFANDLIQTAAAGGTVHIEFTNASFATLASGQSLSLDGTVFAPTETQAQAPQQIDPATLQARIEAGEDITEIMEAAAAGAAGGSGGGNEGSSFVVVQQNAARGDVTPGFETGTFSDPLPIVPVGDGLLLPADAEISISIITDVPPPSEGEDGRVSSVFSNALFEDARPDQHLDGQSGDVVPGYLQINLATTGSTVVDSLDMSGFTSGTRLEIEGGRVINITDPGQVVTFTPAEIAARIAVYAPENNSDADMNIAYTLNYSNALGSNSTSGSFVVVMDAVADLPAVGVGYVNTEFQDSSGATELKTVTFPVTAEFTDTDGSEHHYIILEGIPAGWELRDLPPGWQPLAPADVEYPAGYAGDGFVLLVPGDQATVTGNISFDPKDWSNERGVDGTPHTSGTYDDGVSIIVKAATWEHDLAGGEITVRNNYSETGAETPLTVFISEDKPEFTSGSVKVVLDETPGVQHRPAGVDEIASLGVDVKAIVTGLGLSDHSFVSAASDKVSYDLKSDGTGDVGGDAGQAKLAFEVADGTDSGWKTTAGESIFLYQQDGHVVGRVGGEDGPVAFVVTVTNAGLASGVNSADITFIQYQSLQHANTGSHNELMQPGLGLTLQLTDDDGDTTTMPVSINVRDDGPTLSWSDFRVNLSETDLVGGTDQLHLINNAGGNLLDESVFLGFIGFSYGVDGPASLAGPAAANPFAWDVTQLEGAGYQTYDADGKPVDVVWNLSADGLTVTGYAEGGSIDNPVIVIKGVLSAGGATYSVDQSAALIHDQPAHDNTLKLKVPFTITDGDGDTSKGDLTISIQDDVPCAGLCDINDMVFEKDLRDGGIITASGGLTAIFGADGAAATDPVKWDVNAIEATVGELKIIIDGKVYDAEVNLISATEFEVRAAGYDYNGGDASMTVKIVAGDNGGYTYEYTQVHALQHSGGFNLDNVVKELHFTYVVTDGDGDTASNTLQVHVMDSVLLPGVTVNYVDETNHDANDVITKVMDLNLDVFAPDGMDTPKWNLAEITVALHELRVTGSDHPLKFSASDDGKILYITDQSSKAVLTLSMSQNADGTWSLEYKQEQSLDHPLGSYLPGLLGHNDAILLPLDIIARDAEGNHVHNPLVITVFDDAPSIPYGTMTGVLENFQNIGSALGIVGKLESIDWSLGNILNIPGLMLGIISDITTIGGDVFDSTLELVDLVFGTNYSQLGNIADWDWSLGNIVNNIGTIAGIFTNAPANNWLAESPDHVYGGNMNVDFGYDGAHATQAVTFSNTGLEMVLKLFGIHKTGSDTSLETVRDHSDLGSYSLAAGATVMDAVKAYSGDPAKGDLVLTFLTIDNGNGTYSYQVITNGPLSHDPSLIDALLARLMTPESIGSMGDTMDTLLNDLLGLGLPVSQITDALKGFSGVALGTDTLMLIPMPIVAQDNDGDKTMGLATVVVRDSVPELNYTGSSSVSESGLSDGTQMHWDTSVGTRTEHGGEFTVKAFDGVRGLYIDGKEVAFGEKLPLGPGHIVFELLSNADGVSTITYTYTLTDTAEHQGQGTAATLVDGDLKVDFKIVDGDGDISSGSGSITITIVDDMPIAIADFDTLALENAIWTATGNILSGVGTTAAEGSTEQAAADKFGADDRREADGLKVTGMDGEHTIASDAPGEIAIEGQYGTLYMQADGEYRYELDPAKVAAYHAETTTVPQDPLLTMFNASTTTGSLDGFSAQAFNGTNIGSNLNKSLTEVQTWASNNADELAFTRDGLGVKGSTVTLGVDGDQVGQGQNIVVWPPSITTRTEGLLFTLDEPAIEGFSITFGGMTVLVDTVTVYLYGENGQYLGFREVTQGDLLGSSAKWTYDGSDSVTAFVVAPKNVTTAFTVESVSINQPSIDVPNNLTNAEENFNYTLTDADGDVTNATLTIEVNTTPVFGLPEGNSLVGILHDDGLPGGIQDDGATHPVSGSQNFAINTFGEGLGELKIGGKDITLPTAGNPTTTTISPDGASYTVSVTVSVDASGKYSLTYSYILNTAYAHEAGSDSASFSYTIEATDRNGDVLKDADGNAYKLDLTILDDGPATIADAGSLAEAVGTLVVDATGGVLSNDKIGADSSAGFTVQGVSADDATNIARTGNVGSEVTGEYGKLTLNADGSYSYQLTADVLPNVVVNDVFTYTIKDADGDWKTTTLTIFITGDAHIPLITVPTTGGEVGLVYEAGLPGGTDSLSASETDTGAFTVKLNGESGSITVGTGADALTWTVNANGSSTMPVGSYNTGEGILTITGTRLDGEGAVRVEYSYTLKDAQTHADANGNNTLSDSVAISVTDATGDTGTGTLTITIVDDVPTAYSDTLTLPGGDNSVSGNVITGMLADGVTGTGTADIYGADDKHATNGVAFSSTVTFTPEGGGAPVTLTHNASTGALTEGSNSYGTLILNTDGTYTYTRPATGSVKGDIEVGYTIKDADSDTASATLTITVNASLITIGSIIPDSTSLSVHEDGLAVIGTHAGEVGHNTVTSGIIQIESEGGLGSVTIDGHIITLPTNWNGDAYTPPLNGATWSTTNGTMTVDSISYNTSSEKYEVSFTYTLLTSSQAHSVDGATGAAHHDTLSAGGAAAKDAMPQFTVTATDASGRTSDNAGVIKIDIFDDGPVLNLVSATADSDGNIHLGNSFMTSGSLNVDYGADKAASGTTVTDGPLTLTFEGTRHATINGQQVASPFNETLAVNFDANGKASVITGLGIVELTKGVNGEITYRYLAKHGLKGDSETLTLTAQDGDGDTALGNFKVYMDHDVPAGTSYVDEAGLTGLGSHHAGYSDVVQTFQVFLPEGTNGFTWDIDAIKADTLNAIKADANGDGKYSNVTWSVDASNNLIGMAEGKTVITITPSITTHDDGAGNHVADFTVKLDYPIQHDAPTGGATSDFNVKSLYLDFKATYTEDGKSMSLENAVAVSIIDDTPAAQPVNLAVVETVTTPEDVYLVLDVSSSLSDAELLLAKNALIALVNKYVSEGIEAKFSLVTFGADAFVQKDHVSAAEMLKYLNDTSNLRAGHIDGTNYDSALDVTQRLIEAGLQNGETSSYQQKVYFISDGAPNRAMDSDFTSWKAYIAAHNGTAAGNDQIEVYAVGVGLTQNSSAWNTLMTVTKDGANHGVYVSSYNDLANALKALVSSGSAQGNLLGTDMDRNDSRSADLTTVTSATFAGETKAVTAAGVTFTDAANGVTLKIYADGRYEISSSKSVTADKPLDLKFTIKDADGDSSTSQNVKIILQDAKPEAFDNLAVKAAGYVEGITGLTPTIVLDNFNSTTNNGWSLGRSDSGIAFGSGGKVVITAVAAQVAQGNNFNAALRDVTGKTAAELFASGMGGGAGATTVTNPAAGNYIEKAFNLYTAGNLKFDFSFDRGNSNNNTSGSYSTSEHAFAVLMDANGKVVWSGVIEPNPNQTSNVTTGIVTIPVANAGQYTLLIGCFDAGGGTMPALSVNELNFVPNLTAGANVYHGNMVEDKSPVGLTDRLGDGARLDHIIIAGVAYSFNAEGLLVHTFANGDKLTVRDTGEYSFQTVRGSFDDVNIGYTIKESASGDLSSATLYIRSDDNIHRGSQVDLSADTDNNVIIGAASASNILHGGAGDDVIYGGDGNDVIHGGAGNDVIYGNAGNDVMHGDAGNDVIYGNAGDDTLYGGTGGDVLIGGAGNDTLYGGTGHNILVGDDVNLGAVGTLLGKNDAVTPAYDLFVNKDTGDVDMAVVNAFKAALSGTGNDILVGGPEDNVLFGGGGSDTFKYQSGDLDGKVHGDLIGDFHVGRDSQADVLDISDLLTGVTKDNALSGGFLKFDNITNNADGTTTVKLSIDADGSAGTTDSKALATIVMDGVNLSGSVDQQMQQLFDQLVNNDQIKF